MAPASASRAAIVAFWYCTGTEGTVVALGGLADTLLQPAYLPGLGERLQSTGWGLLQPQLSSAGMGYGTTDLEQDAHELQLVLQNLNGPVVLLGHSTGCQIIVVWRRLFESSSVVGAILQGPVSDREGADHPYLHHANEMIQQGRGSECLPRDADPAYITANRYISLYSFLGDDDMFSSDLGPEILSQRLAALKGIPSLLVYSEQDQYVPSFVDKSRLLGLFQQAIGNEAYTCLLPNSNHEIGDAAGRQLFYDMLLGFLERTVVRRGVLQEEVQQH